jgi:hypothetical protein
MNDKILKLAQSLIENKDCKNQRFNLTLNYKEVIKDDYQFHMVGTSMVYDRIVYPLLNEEGFKRIEDELSKEKVKSFNLTVKFENGIKGDINGGDSFAVDWHTLQFIFHGFNKKIIVSFDCLSSYCGLDQTHFNQFFKKPIIITEDKIDECIQNLVHLKNLLSI